MKNPGIGIVKAEITVEDAIHLYLDLISSLSNNHDLESTKLIQEYCKRLKEILIPNEALKQ